MTERTARRNAPDPAEAVTFSEDGDLRYLHLGDTPWVQGAMNLDAPDVLALEYVQQMTAWLAIRHAPKRALQLGLGAGALTRWHLRHLRGTRTTVVERNPAVIIAARAMFGVPADNARLEVVQADAGAYVAAAAPGSFDLLQVDLYDAAARGPVLDSQSFYDDCRRVLAEPGVLVVNLFGRASVLKPNLARLRRAFDGRLVELPACGAGNRVVLALAGPALDAPADQVDARLDFLEARFGLPYRRWLAGARDADGRLRA